MDKTVAQMEVAEVITNFISGKESFDELIARYNVTVSSINESLRNTDGGGEYDSPTLAIGGIEDGDTYYLDYLDTDKGISVEAGTISGEVEDVWDLYHLIDEEEPVDEEEEIFNRSKDPAVVRHKALEWVMHLFPNDIREAWEQAGYSIYFS